MDVTAVFELPVHIWVMCDALGATYPTGYGDLRFDVVMPTDQPPVGGPPAVAGIALRPELTGEQVVWAKDFAAYIPDSRRPATALHRVAMTDVDGPSYDGHRSWCTANHQLAEQVNDWFDSVRTWAEVLTGQDLDPSHRVYDAESVGGGLTFIEPPHDGALGFTYAMPHIRPLHAQEWAGILRFVRDGRQPPLEEVLSRDARAAHRRNANRRAIIDAATALEITLGRHVRSVADQLPEAQRNRINQRTALGGYIDIAEQSHLQLAVPVDRLRWLNNLRNDAAHRGATPGHLDTYSGVQIMIDFLTSYGQIPRENEREPDGGEWISLDSDDGVLDESQRVDERSKTDGGSQLA